MSQKKVQIKKTLGQQTEDQLMKYILDNQIAIGEKIPNEFELAGIFDVVPCSAPSFARRLIHELVESVSFAKWTVLPAHFVSIACEIVSSLYRCAIICSPALLMLLP